jgi:YVTN family beta-propeller protein
MPRLARIPVLALIVLSTAPAAARPGHRLLASLDLGPKQISMSPDGTELWATELYIHRIAIVDTRRLRVKDVIKIPGEEPVEVVHRKDGGEVWVSILNRRKVLVFDARTRRVTHTIPVGWQPKGIAFTPDERLAFVTNWKERSVTVVDVERKRPIRTLRVGRVPRGVSVTPDGKEAWVAGFVGRDIHIIDVDTLAVKEVIRDLKRDPRHLVFSPDGKTAYLACNRAGVVQVIDVATRTVKATVKTGVGGRSIILAHGGRYAYVANYFTRQVAVLDTRSLRVVERIPALKQCIAVAVTPDGERLFVSNYNSWKVLAFEVPAWYRDEVSTPRRSAIRPASPSP